MSMEPNKTPKAPTFLGAILYLVAGFIIEASGLGLIIIGPPSYYPRAVWYTIDVLEAIAGGIALGLAYVKLRQFFNYVDVLPEGELEYQEAKNPFPLEQDKETLAEHRP